MRNLIPHFIQEEYTKGHYEGAFEALTMFVDVSGFTPMTQALMKRGHEGAEILAMVMNGIFDALINATYERGGFVSTFAGDAFTAIFPFNNSAIPSDELIVHVLACVKTFQALFLRHGIQTTPQGQFPLQFRVGLSGGTVEWGIVGKTLKVYFFRGEAIDGCAASEHHAEKGDVIFDNNVAQRLRKVPGAAECARHIRALQVERFEGGYYRIKKLPESLCEDYARPALPDLPALHAEVLAQFFPEAITNLAEMGEFRHVVSIFISFEGGLSLSELNGWVEIVIDRLKVFGGYFNRISFGDKGGFLLCGFGAPVTYEHIVNRALGFILSVRHDVPGMATLPNLKFRAGITYGMAYAGIAGGEKRCEYTYHGEVVNLAARFMMKAEWGEILASKAVCDRTVQFNFTHKGDFMYKGIAEPVSTWLLTGRKTGIRHHPFTEVMIGRQAELQRLRQLADPIFARTNAGIICIYGEAGMGKSRLAYALQEELTAQHDLYWFNCPADQIVRKPFNPFVTCLARYFDQASEITPEENRARFEEKYAALVAALPPHPLPLLETPHPNPLPKGEGEIPPLLVGEGPEVRFELIRTKSVIGAQLGLSMPDSLWEQLDAKGKYDNIVAAIKNFFLAHSLLHPVVIELEDGQWLDNDSLLALHLLTCNVSTYPLLILITLRYNEDGSKLCLLDPQDLRERKIPHEVIELREFSDVDLRSLAEAHLAGPISEEFYAVLAEKANGNPFFAEQLLHYFIENKFMQRKHGEWYLNAGDTPLPDTINAVLSARIDRLADQVKDVVKTAAVIGREFEIVLLSAILKGNILSQVQMIRKAQIWEEVQELHYMFKHALLRDIAYGMQLKARLRELHHLIAETMETLYAAGLPKRYADLAYHYERAEINDKAIEYLEKAADEAKAQYQNQQALDLYDRLLSQLQNVFGFPAKEIDTLLKKAEILELTGQWMACQDTCEEAIRFAHQIGDVRRIGRGELTLSLILGRTGDYEQAVTYLDQALKRFEAANEREGIGRVLTTMGFFHWQRSDYNAAMLCYAKALTIKEALGDQVGTAKNANNIGIIYDMQGDYNAAMTWYRKSLQICEALGEKQERSRVLNNMGECHRENRGDYEAAMDYYQQALPISEELGDKLQTATTLGNIGHVYAAQGEHETAIGAYDRAIAILGELGNTYLLCEYLPGKARMLFMLQRYDEAQAVNAEGLVIVEATGRKECLFQGNLLSARIDFALGNKDAPQRLIALLEQTHDATETALLHYELWKMTDNEEHRQSALTQYQTLYESTPHSDYQKRIEEMNLYAQLLM